MARGNRSQTSQERTAEERERDRVERERRRAQEPARPPIPEPQPVVEPAPPIEPTQPIEPAPPIEPAQSIEPEPPIAPPPLPPRADRARGGRPPHGGGRLTRARIAALVALALAIALVWFVLSLFQPFAGGGSGRVMVQIPKGSSSSEIGSILAHDEVVSSGFFFNLRALLAGKRSSLHSGRFVLKHDMSYSAAIDALSKPPPRVIAVKVVIPEGYTRRQISELVREDALSGDYLAASERSRLLSPRHYGAPRGTRDLEGFLFPATYDLRAGAPVQKLVDEQLIAFRRRFGSADVRRAHALGVTPYEMLTVASMVEREAQSEHDRPLIAAVIYNRLREGIPLGIDATIYYAVEQQKGIATYTGELTQSMLKIDSPYNTRTHKGLPPTPISNPGEASIHAAAHPAHVPYLYYVAGADGCGGQVFSKSYAQFEKDVAAYDAAVKKNGGKPPACKKK
ncbi:MAG: endolytic transglycosylase MltG [Solirubrobacterales bacterium]